MVNTSSSGRRKRPLLTLIVLIFALGGFFSIFTFSCETEMGVVNLALKKGEKTYLYSLYDTEFLQSILSRDEVPATTSFITVFNENGLFVDPNYVSPICEVLSGNYAITESKEPSFDGYLTKNKTNVVSEAIPEFKNTENIGEQILHHHITLKNLSGDREMSIVWDFNPQTGSYKAIENCEEKSFMVTTSVQPGEWVTSSKDFIMVNLQTLVSFYDNRFELELNIDENLLCFVSKD